MFQFVGRLDVQLVLLVKPNANPQMVDNNLYLETLIVVILKCVDKPCGQILNARRRYKHELMSVVR